MDISIANRADWETRRKIRLAQVRDQSKAIAKTIRDRVHGAVDTRLEQHETARNKTEQKFKSLALNKLKSDFNYLIQDVGSGYSIASVQPDPNIVIAEKRLINRCKAISRGAEAEKRIKRVEENQQIDKEMKERRVCFNKTVEKIRSALITSVPKVDNGNNHVQYINKHNQCFLIPSQVTLNESNIMDWNSNKTISKPWSMVIDSNVNAISKFSEPMSNDDDKENVSAFTKLEADIKDYETLVLELNKLSAEEQQIRDNLSTENWKDFTPVPCKNNKLSEKRGENKYTNMTRIKDKSPEPNEKQNPIYGKRFDESNTSSSFISSSTSTSINYDHNVLKKTIRFENEENQMTNNQSSFKLNYNKKLSPEKPLRNINNIVQRIRNKKQLLAKEVAAHSKVDIKKSKAVSSVPKTSPIPKRCLAGNDLDKESVINCAKLTKIKTKHSVPKTSSIPKRCATGNVLRKESSANCTKPTKLKTARSIPKTLPLPKKYPVDTDLDKESVINCSKPTKIKTKCSIQKISPITKTSVAGNDLQIESPTNYATLPDSFYNDLIQTIKEQISKNKLNHTDSKCTSSINKNLMDYINTLLEMAPSDVDNLSISSCSSIKLEESILQHSKTNTHEELLNCISKCLNTDISDLSPEIEFDSPENINLLNKLQGLVNYYLEKTHEMENICNESPQSLNELNSKAEAAINDENSSVHVVSSDSSVDGGYVLNHLSTLLQKKGLIKPDKEWPMFENLSDNDDNRSLTDQLLNIYPRKSYDASCSCQKRCVQKYNISNIKNEAQLQHPLDYINEKLNWIKKKKRLLFDEIYTNQAPESGMQSINNISDIHRDYPKENLNYVGLPDSFCNSTLKILEEYVNNKKTKTSKSNNNNNNNNNTWINMELMNYICNLLKMSPYEVDNLSITSNSSNQLEQSILEISKANLEYHKDILNYISQCLDNSVCDINRDQAFSSPQSIGLLDKLYQLADYYTEKAQEMRNICLESPRVEINNLDTDTIEEISEPKRGDQKTSCSLSSELSVDGAYILEHLSSLLEQKGLICGDREWPIFGNDDEDDSRSLTDQLLDIKPQIKSNDIKIETSEKGKLLFYQ